MPLEDGPWPVKTYAILLRNSQPEKVHGKPGHAIPLPPSRKKIPPWRPPLYFSYDTNVSLSFTSSVFPVLA